MKSYAAVSCRGEETPPEKRVSLCRGPFGQNESRISAPCRLPGVAIRCLGARERKRFTESGCGCEAFSAPNGVFRRESFIVGAVRVWLGELAQDAMLKHLCEGAKSAVRIPIVR